MSPGARSGAVAVPCTTEQCVLGEGVRWDTRRDELLRVDIVAGRVFRDRVADDGALVRVRSYQLGGTVGAIAPIDGDDGWLLAAGRGFAHLAPDGVVRTIVDEVAAPGTRMNDAACDPRGRFWAGTMAHDQSAGAGALLRLDRTGRVEQVLDGLTISNGLGWSSDAATMYITDSADRSVYAYDFDAVEGTLSRGRVLLTVHEQIGAPDGLTVDAAGHLWVAIYGGGRVHRYAPDGCLLDVLEVPAEQTTCCVFAGADLDRLFVTTATEGWTDERRRAEPGAGVVYRFDTDATGNPAAPFRPDPGWWATVTR